MEVAARLDPSVGQDHRVVDRRARARASATASRVGERVAGGAVDLRRAAQRVGVLHAGVVLAMAGDDRRAVEQAAQVGRAARPARPAGAARSGPRRRRGPCRAAPRPTSPRSRRRPRSSARGRRGRAPASPRMPSVPLISASPSFARSVSGSIPASPSASAAGRGSPVAVDDLPLADQRQRAVRERREVAARAERAVLGDDRRDAGVEQLEDRLGDLRPGARVPHGQRPRAQQHHRPHHLALDRRPHAGGVRADQRPLQLLAPLRRDRGVGQRAEPGRDAVDGLLAAGEPLDVAALPPSPRWLPEKGWPGRRSARPRPRRAARRPRSRSPPFRVPSTRTVRAAKPARR